MRTRSAAPKSSGVRSRKLRRGRVHAVAMALLATAIGVIAAMWWWLAAAITWTPPSLKFTVVTSASAATLSAVGLCFAVLDLLAALRGTDRRASARRADWGKTALRFTVAYLAVSVIILPVLMLTANNPAVGWSPVAFASFTWLFVHVIRHEAAQLRTALPGEPASGGPEAAAS